MYAVRSYRKIFAIFWTFFSSVYRSLSDYLPDLPRRGQTNESAETVQWHRITVRYPKERSVRVIIGANEKCKTGEEMRKKQEMQKGAQLTRARARESLCTFCRRTRTQACRAPFPVHRVERDHIAFHDADLKYIKGTRLSISCRRIY